MRIPTLENQNIDRSRAQELFDEHRQIIFKQTDRLFVGLMLFQWIAGIVLALVVSPKTWVGAESQTHIHVWAAVFLGGGIASVPIALGIFMPGEKITRYVVATSQMLFSALLIHLTGGRIETHFHVFGSLAFLAFYRDWKVLVPATIVVAVDHMLRGIFWPQSVFGVLSAGSWRWVEHTAWVLFENIFLFFSCRRSVREMWKIAERTAEAESELAKSQKTLAQLENLSTQLEQSNRQLEQFAYTAAHDLKSPLRILKMYSQVLEKKFRNPEAGELIKTIIDSANNLEQLTTSLLEYAKVQKVKKEFQQVDCEKVLRRALSSLALDIEESGAKVFNYPLGTIIGDETLLSQLFQNLISNAIKFRSAASPHIEISRFYDQKISVFAVKDNGLGLDDEEDVFEIFRRGHSHIEGSGIGLATCKKIVEIHGGKIWVQSRPGKGSTFYFTLSQSPIEQEAVL